MNRRQALVILGALACISNEVPAKAISNALWKGVRLADVLQRAGGPGRAAVDLVFTCADNYTDSITVAKALEKTTILAYEMNGEPLPKLHGFPLRAIVPGIYGMKNAKWIEATEIDAVGRPLGAGGIAFAGDRGIRSVEVSADGGQSWMNATVKPPLGAFTWVLWALEWTSPALGSYTLTVRATDGTGTVQPVEKQDPAPDGATGWHSIPVKVA